MLRTSAAPMPMTRTQADTVRHLLRDQDVAALGTLNRGEPFVSMVPFALLPDGNGFVIHVSRLATHTADMQQHAAVSLMVCDVREPGTPPQGLARATVQGDARTCVSGSEEHAAAQHAYLSRFPESEPMFDFGDFSLVVIVPRAVRVVGGFAQAWSATPADLAVALSAGER